MSIIDRVDRFQRKHAVVGFPIGVLYKFFDDMGFYLAALISYYAFLSLFPALLLLTTILSLVLQGNPDLQQRILDSAFAQFPVVGDKLGTPEALNFGTWAWVIGVVGSLYGGIGVAQAIQYAMNTMWSVPRNTRPNPLAARGRSLVLLVVGGAAVLITAVITRIGASDIMGFGQPTRWVVTVLSVAANTGLFTLVFFLATGRRLGAHRYVLGAFLAALCWQTLQHYGVVYVDQVVSRASTTSGVFAIVLGLVAFLHLTSLCIVMSAEVNVVLLLHLWPRALLTPFTDNVDLTPGDKRSYEDMARTQRQKGQQTIEVEFGDRPDRDPPDAPDPPDSGPPERGTTPDS